MSSNFTSVSKSHPCRACEGQDDCSFTTDGAIQCRRGPFEGAVEKSDTNGRLFWLRQPENPKKSDKFHVSQPKAALTCLERRHQVYSEVLSHLGLTPKHRSELIQRGFAEADLANLGFKSLTREDRGPIVTRVAETWPDWQTIPGFYVSEKTNKPMFGGAQGLVIPCPDLQGRIQGLRTRADNPGENGRYGWLSSAKHGGPGPGSPSSYWPAQNCDDSCLRLTEGELKAALSAIKTGVTTVSGGSGIGSLANAQIKDWLNEIGQATVLFGPDSDAFTKETVNREVRSVLARLVAFSKIQGFVLLVEVWDQSQKGIDDALVAGLPIQRLTPFV